MKIILIIFLILNTKLVAQSDLNLSFTSYPEEKKYFWADNNNFGKKPIENQIDIFFKRQSNNSIFVFNISNAYTENQFKFGTTFYTFMPRDSKFFNDSEIKIGKYYKDFSEYLNDDLSLGSMIVSNNAQPLPKLGFKTNFDPKKNKNLNFKFGIAHGFFEENIYYDEAPFLHEKFIYLNYKNSNLTYGLGMVHSAIWGGSTFQLGKQPSSLRDFLKVFISADGTRKEGEPHANAIGSHVGIWDFYLIKDSKKMETKFYYQHYFEDTSSLRFENKFDGIWGMEINNKLKKQIFLLEYFSTVNSFINPPYQGDFYYWNYEYLDGWRYKNKIIGNPMVSFPDEKKRVELREVINIAFVKNWDKNSFQIKFLKKINIQDDIQTILKYKKTISEKYSIELIGFSNQKDFDLGIKFDLKI